MLSMLTDLKDRVEAGEDESIARDAAASVYLGELRVKASSVLTCLSDVHIKVPPIRYATLVLI